MEIGGPGNSFARNCELREPLPCDVTRFLTINGSKSNRYCRGNRKGWRRTTISSSMRSILSQRLVYRDVIFHHDWADGAPSIIAIITGARQVFGSGSCLCYNIPIRNG